MTRTFIELTPEERLTYLFSFLRYVRENPNVSGAELRRRFAGENDLSEYAVYRITRILEFSDMLRLVPRGYPAVWYYVLTPYGESILAKGSLEVGDIPETPRWLREAVLRPPAPPPFRFWRRKLFVMGTYDPNKRNLEIHFYAPVFEGWDDVEVDEGAKDVMWFFLEKAEYKIPVWDEDNFGVSIDRNYPDRYSEARCPRHYKLVIIDYDYNTTRAEAEFMWDLRWLENIEEFKAEVERHIILHRGRRTGRPPRIRGGQTRLV